MMAFVAQPKLYPRWWNRVARGEFGIWFWLSRKYGWYWWYDAGSGMIERMNFMPPGGRENWSMDLLVDELEFLKSSDLPTVGTVLASTEFGNEVRFPFKGGYLVVNLAAVTHFVRKGCRFQGVDAGFRRGFVLAKKGDQLYGLLLPTRITKPEPATEQNRHPSRNT